MRRRVGHVTPVVRAAAALLSAAALAEAAAARAQTQPLDSVAQTPLFSDLGWRKKLADAGVDLVANFYWEPAANQRGVTGHGVASAEEFDWGAALDLHKLGWSEAGTVRVLFSGRWGEAIQQKFTGA